MGSRQSRVTDSSKGAAPVKEAEGFTVGVTPGLVQSLSGGDAPAKPQIGSPEQVMTAREAEEVQAAYKKGFQDAQNELRHHLVKQKEVWTRELLEREARSASLLHEQVEEFQARKFAAPQHPVLCETEASELAKCYREKKGKELECGSLVDLYQECARKVVTELDVTKQ